MNEYKTTTKIIFICSFRTLDSIQLSSSANLTEENLRKLTQLHIYETLINRFIKVRRTDSPPQSYPIRIYLKFLISLNSRD